MKTKTKETTKDPKDRSHMPSTATWATMPNAERKRPMGTITMAPESWDELDRRRGDTPRGAYIEQQFLQKKRSKKTA
jgi:hypothetical protein